MSRLESNLKFRGGGDALLIMRAQLSTPGRAGAVTNGAYVSLSLAANTTVPEDGYGVPSTERASSCYLRVGYTHSNFGYCQGCLWYSTSSSRDRFH